MLEQRWVAGPLSAMVWTSWVALVILSTPIVLLFRAFTFPWDRDRRRVGRLFHRVAVLAGDLNPFWKFRLLGAREVDGRRPRVVVANHSSFTDVFLVARVPWEMKWLSKAAIFRIPLLGWQMRVAGDVPIVRGDKASVARAMAGLKDRLARGVSVTSSRRAPAAGTAASASFAKAPSASRSKPVSRCCPWLSSGRRRRCRSTPGSPPDDRDTERARAGFDLRARRPGCRPADR